MPGITLDADLAITLNDTLSDLHKLIRRMAIEERQEERFLEPPFGFAVGSNAFVTADVGGPAQGRIWQVTRLAVEVAPLGSSRPTGATLYLMTGPANSPSNFFTNAVNIEAAYTTYPISANWGSRQFMVQFPEHLVVAVQNGSTAHQIGGQVAVTDLPEHTPYPIRDVQL